MLHRFDSGNEKSDTALRWFVDVRCEGKKLPTEGEAIRAWLLDNADSIHRGLEMLAEKLEVGMEPEGWPLVFPIPKTPSGVKINLVCSAVRRLDALAIAEILSTPDREWEEVVQILEENEPAVTR